MRSRCISFPACKWLLWASPARQRASAWWCKNSLCFCMLSWASIWSSFGIAFLTLSCRSRSRLTPDYPRVLRSKFLRILHERILLCQCICRWLWVCGIRLSLHSKFCIFHDDRLFECDLEPVKCLVSFIKLIFYSDGNWSVCGGI